MSEAWKKWEGRTVDNRFPLRRYLGASEHSAVFLTERAGAPVPQAAIKLIASKPNFTDGQLVRWKKVSALSHPHLLSLYEWGRSRLDGVDLLYVVMEFANENLSEILPQRPLSESETRQMLEPVVDALAFVHSKGFVHGRIQPANILAVNDNIRLSADSLCPSSEAKESFHEKSSYDPPEAAQRIISTAGDVYSLGLTLVETLTQRSPDQQKEWEQQKEQGNSVQSEPLPAPLDEIALNSLHSSPAMRWSIVEILERLDPAKAKLYAPPPAPPRVAPAPIKSVTVAKKEAKEIKETTVPPLSVPLSPVPPLPKASQQPQSPGGSGLQYLFAPILIVVGFALAGILVVKHYSHSTNSQRTTVLQEVPARPSKVAEKTVARADVSLPATSQPELKAAPKPEPKPELNRESKPEPPAETRPLQPVETPVAATPSPAATVESSTAVLHSEISAKPPANSSSDDSQILNQVMPNVSEKALETIHGTVRVAIRVTVDSTGNVVEADVETPSPSKFFNDLALQASRKWQFLAVNADPTSDLRQWVLHFDFSSKGTKVLPKRSAI